MITIKELFQSADWKKEKHVPVIEMSDKFKKGDVVKISVCVGKEISHAYIDFVPEELEESCERAVQECPVEAIKIDDNA